MARVDRRTQALRLRSGRAALTLALVAVCLPFAGRMLAGPRGAEIHVRWQSSVDAATRSNLESLFHLRDGERLAADTWRYDLIDTDAENIRAIVDDANVADTHDLDRSTYLLSASAIRTDRRQRFGDAGIAIVTAADWLALGLLALTAAVLVLPHVKRQAAHVSRGVVPLLAGSRAPLATTLAAILRFLQRGIPEIDAGTAGIFRIVFGLLLMAFFWSRAVDSSWLAATFDLEIEGAFHALVIDWLRSHPAIVDLVTPWLLVTGAAFTIGLFTRATYALFVAGALVWAYVAVSLDSTHPHSTLVLALVALLPSRWGDALSVDSWRRGGAAAPLEPLAPDGRHYGYSVWVPGLVFGVGYAAAAWAKMAQGPRWILNGTVKYHFITDSSIAPFDWGLQLASYPRLAIAASFFAVATEALLISAAFTRSEAYRALVGLAAFGLLAGFWVFMGHFWPGWWILLIGFLPWEHISQALADRKGPRRAQPVGADAARAFTARDVLTAAQLAVILFVLGQQIVFSTIQVERAPMFSHYPMYSGTYADAAAYEASRPPRYRIVAATDHGSVELRCSPHEEFVREFDAALEGSPRARANVWRALSGCGEDPQALRSVTLEGEVRTFDWQGLTFTSRAAPLRGPLCASLSDPCSSRGESRGSDGRPAGGQ
jgi:hypothetical protein